MDLSNTTRVSLSRAYPCGYVSRDCGTIEVPRIQLLEMMQNEGRTQQKILRQMEYNAKQTTATTMCFPQPTTNSRRPLPTTIKHQLPPSSQSRRGEHSTRSTYTAKTLRPNLFPMSLATRPLSFTTTVAPFSLNTFKSSCRRRITLLCGAIGHIAFSPQDQLTDESKRRALSSNGANNAMLAQRFCPLTCLLRRSSVLFVNPFFASRWMFRAQLKKLTS